MSKVKIKFTDKDLHAIKDRTHHEWKLMNGENALARAYVIAISLWLKENGVDMEVPEYKPRDLSINSSVED